MSEAVKDMINQALDNDFNNANNVFNDIMTIKLNDLLDQEKIRIADSIYNGVEDDEEDDPDEEQLELDLEAEGELESDEEDDEEEVEDEDEDDEEYLDDDEEDKDDQ